MKIIVSLSPVQEVKESGLGMDMKHGLINLAAGASVLSGVVAGVDVEPVPETGEAGHPQIPAGAIFIIG